MIEIQVLNKRDLASYIVAPEFDKLDFVPISKARAVSHCKNPRADDDDILLLLALEDGKLAGYLGCYPDQLSNDAKNLKFAWLSTIFIDPQFRGKGIAKKLLQKSFEVYNGNIVLTEFTAEAESLYNKVGKFVYREPKKGKRYYFLFNSVQIMPARSPKFQKFEPLFGTLDKFANIFVLKQYWSPNFDKKRVQILDSVDTESFAFIEEFSSYRHAKEINAILQYPWVLEGQPKDGRYLFSSTAKQFKYYWVKIFDTNGQLQDCALLSLRDGHLKVCYLFSKSNLQDFSTFLTSFIRKNKVRMLTTYQVDLIVALDKSKTFSCLHQRDFERRYLFHQDLIVRLPTDFQFNFQDGDGDCMGT